MSVSESPRDEQRGKLRRLLYYFSLIIVAAVIYVLLDFAFDARPPAIHSSYRFSVAVLGIDEARILRQDNLSILVVRRSAATIRALEQMPAALQDAESRSSHQPDYARNPLRSRHAEYFVSYAIGTDLGCALQILDLQLQEICGSARYDFAGRALQAENKFQNLSIPDYTFADNFQSLVVKP